MIHLAGPGREQLRLRAARALLAAVRSRKIHVVVWAFHHLVRTGRQIRWRYAGSARLRIHLVHGSSPQDLGRYIVLALLLLIACPHFCDVLFFGCVKVRKKLQ